MIYINLSEVEEDQNSISEWAESTFGDITGPRAITRTNKEMAELLTIISMPVPAIRKPFIDKIRDECADILIILFQVANVYRFDLMLAVDEKMKINRARKWKLDGTGCGQHIEEESNVD